MNITPFDAFEWVLFHIPSKTQNSSSMHSNCLRDQAEYIKMLCAGLPVYICFGFFPCSYHSTDNIAMSVEVTHRLTDPLLNAQG